MTDIEILAEMQKNATDAFDAGFQAFNAKHAPKNNPTVVNWHVTNYHQKPQDLSLKKINKRETVIN